MLTKLEQTTQKLGGINSAVDTWLEERKQLLVQYCQLAGLPPFERETNALPDKDEIEKFCEILMDYISAGHFEIYQKIMAECAESASNSALAEEIYAQFSDSTDTALSFNDQYASVSDEHDLDIFDVNLAQLGQKMEERFGLEDRLLQTLVN